MDCGFQHGKAMSPVEAGQLKAVESASQYSLSNFPSSFGQVEALGIILRLRVSFDLAQQWNGVFLTCDAVTEAVYLRPC